MSTSTYQYSSARGYALRAADHAWLAPVEEFILHLLHVFGDKGKVVTWPAEHVCIMAEKQDAEPKCKQCAYRAGHGKVLTATEEAKFLQTGSVCLFMRKVQGPGAASE